MDEFDPNLVSEGETSTQQEAGSRKLLLIALAVGAAGLLFGLAGMYMANQAGKRAQALSAAVEEVLARPDASAELKAALADIDSRLVTFGDQIVRLNNVDRQLQDGLRRTTEATGTELRTMREALAETRTAVGDLSRVVTDLREVAASSPRVAASSASAAAGSSAPAVTADGMRVHTVRSGENPSRIAAAYGVTVEAIMQANPGLNPQRMQVGQQIVVPVPAQ
ncbi:MAG: LysM peptidoglycan-binding domain-containing protein [Verrucomicrobia bacterium]|nr:LysM peptidoglycan-binding domain-containing protein [Verrucomicrobiota bacterium]